MRVLFPQARSVQLEERMRIAFVGSCLPIPWQLQKFSSPPDEKELGVFLLDIGGGTAEVRTGQPGYMGVKSPIYSTAVGMIHYAQRSFMITQPKNSPVKAAWGLWSRIRHWFLDLLA